MTESQQRKILNIQSEINKIDDKIDKLLIQRQLLIQQAAKIRAPKVPRVLTEEERKAQSLKDKAAYQQKLSTTASQKMKRMNLLGD